MRSVLVLASLFVAHTAFAQAPGEYQPTPPPGYYAPPPAQVLPPTHWSIGLAVGSLGLAPQATPDMKTNFAIGELALRYRFVHFELEGAIGGGREQLPDHGGQGDLEVSTVALNARYRFRPGQNWNWWLGAGVGALAVASHEATDQERKDATRPMFQLGVGLEYRWVHFALSAELRAIGVGPKDPNAMQQPQPVMSKSTGTPTAAPDDSQSGGQFTIGANYYF
jgi:opacity protein-like surface antigen